MPDVSACSATDGAERLVEFNRRQRQYVLLEWHRIRQQLLSHSGRQSASAVPQCDHGTEWKFERRKLRLWLRRWEWRQLASTSDTYRADPQSLECSIGERSGGALSVGSVAIPHGLRKRSRGFVRLRLRMFQQWRTGRRQFLAVSDLLQDARTSDASFADWHAIARPRRLRLRWRRKRGRFAA